MATSSKTTSAAKTSAQATGLKFVEELPAAERATSASDKYAAEAATLRDNPGRWAVLKEYEVAEGASGAGARSSAWRLAKGVRDGKFGFGPGFEATTRTNGHLAVYVRYVGTDSARDA